MFRTDLGDDERWPDKPPEHKSNQEWSHGRKNGHKDKAGDDDVDILIRANGKVVVKYREAH